MLLQRVLTAVVGIPLFLGALYLGGACWAIFLAAVALLGTRESLRLAGADGRGAWLARLIAFSFLLGAYLTSGDGELGRPVALFHVLLLTAALTASALSGGSGAPAGLQGAGAVIASGVYPGLFLAHLHLLREEGFEYALLAVLVTWATDTGAYAFGSLLGRRPLWPAISPRKTVEGALGGLISGATAGLLLAFLLGEAPGSWLCVAVAASAAAQLGDLVESGLKRKAGVKDSGNLLPGHGGVLDRFDSLLFSGSAVYYLLALL